MKSSRKLLWLLFLVLVIGGAGLVEWFSLVAAQHQAQVRQELKKILGQDATFASLEINLLGRPGFVARDLRLGDDSRFAATPLLRAGECVLGVSVWNLFFRRLVITSLTFNDPELQVIINESGRLNLAALVNRHTELRKFPDSRPRASEHKALPVRFDIDEIRVRHGRIDYLDRSVKEPAELRIRNVSLTLKGFGPASTTQVGIAAAVTEGLGQDLQIDGKLAPPPEKGPWLQRGIDLTLRFDSLRVPVVARAVASLRDKIPSELEVTGPMALQAKAGGTLDRPRFDDIILKVPLLGSTDYNAIIRGSIHFTDKRTWEDAVLKGRLAIESLSLARLRQSKLFTQNLPDALVTDGEVSVYSRFEGTWDNLRMGTLVRADQADFYYGAWFRKPAHRGASVRARISRGKNRLVFHESELDLGANKLVFNGSIDYDRVPRLRLNLRSRRASVQAWKEYFPAPFWIGASGRFDLDLTLVKSLLPGANDWSMAGGLKLKDAEIHRAAGARVSNLDAEVAFAGKGARVRAANFRLGRSAVFLSGTIANLLQPRLVYKLRSPELYLRDLPTVNADPGVRLESLRGIGEIHLDRGGWRLEGSVTSPRGELDAFPFRDLRAEVDLTPSRLGFKNVWARILNGLFRSEGEWAATSNTVGRLRLTAQLKGLEIPALMAHLLPPLRDRFEGQLNGQGHIQLTDSDDDEAQNTFKGTLEASVQQGVIKDFNLLRQLLLGGSGATSVSRLLPSLAELASRSDTAFESLNANFTVDQKRIFTDNLVVNTPDYTVTGAGWIGANRATSWTGAITLSPRLTHAVQRDYRMIRYLLDRRSRLAIPFRVEGKIPHVDIRLENRTLAQALHGGTAPKSAPDNGNETAKKSRPWLPDTLERFLNR